MKKMRLRNVIIGLILSALILAPLMGTALANVPGVAINAPPPPPAPNVPVMGGQGLFKVVVSHRDTMIPATHYIDHLYLFDGDKLIKEWKYTEKDANPNEVYTESLVLPATKDMDLKAIAHCTMHGYNINGVAVTVLPAGTTPMQMVQMNANIAGMQVNGMDPTMAASTATQMVQQDAALLKQIGASEMNMIKQHQMQTTQFFQTDQGKKFLDAFDYTRRMGGAAGQQQAGMAQPGMTAAPGQMTQGQQMMQGQQPGMAATQQGMQGQRVSMQQRMSDMRTGAAQQPGMAAAPGQMAQQQGKMGQQMMAAPKEQGIPQTMWTDSMGNPMSGQDAKQLGNAAAKPMQTGMAAGQQPAMQQAQTPGMMRQAQQPAMQQAQPPAMKQPGQTVKMLQGRATQQPDQTKKMQGMATAQPQPAKTKKSMTPYGS